MKNFTAKNIFESVLLSVFILGFVSCSYKKSSGGPAAVVDPNQGGQSQPSQISYQDVNQAVIAPKCLKCHSNAAGNKGGVNLETYQNVVNLVEVVRDEIDTDGMPINDTLTNSQKKLILDWIDAGHNEFATTTKPIPVDPSPIDPPPVVIPPTEPASGPVVVQPPTLPPPTNPPPVIAELSYENIKQKVLTPACLKCHSNAAGNKGGVNLETYENVLLQKDTVKDEVITRGMPLKMKLTDDQIKLVADWVDAGAPELATPVLVVQ